jgi:uncharacterized protein (TIGR03066 family)
VTKEKIERAKLVGTWTFVKSDSRNPPPEGASIKVTFSKDGKMTMAIVHMGKELTASGTYSVKGDKLTTVVKGPDNKEVTTTMTIKELTDKRFVTIETKKSSTETTEFKK